MFDNINLGKRLPNMKMKDIAAAAGVSVATVSKVLNGVDDHISQATRENIKNIVKETGYVQNAMAKGLKQNRSKMIGFVLPDISNPFFPDVIKGMEQKAHEYGYGVIIVNTNDSVEAENEAIRFLSSKMVGGIIIARALRNEHIENCINTDLPVVIVDRFVDIKGKNIGRVIVDTPKGIYEATNVLFDANCKNIAFISAKYKSKNDRFIGYEKSLKEHGLKIDDDLVYKDKYSFETGYEGISKILKKKKVDGVVCGNDLIAFGVAKYLEEKGIKIPDEIKIMGFDDVYFSKYMHPPLSVIKQPSYEMGAEAADMLIKHLENDTPLYEKVLDISIIKRGTV